MMADRIAQFLLKHFSFFSINTTFLVEIEVMVSVGMSGAGVNPMGANGMSYVSDRT